MHDLDEASRQGNAFVAEHGRGADVSDERHGPAVMTHKGGQKVDPGAAVQPSQHRLQHTFELTGEQRQPGGIVPRTGLILPQLAQYGRPVLRRLGLERSRDLGSFSV